MATYRVMPLPDGVDQRNSWQVKRDGIQISTHTKKSAAERRARSEARSKDRVVLHRTDGTVIGDAPTTARRSRPAADDSSADPLTGLDQPAVDDIEEDIFGDEI